MQSWVAVAGLKFVVSRKKINLIYCHCHVSLASCLFSLLPPVGCCCHSQFTFYSVICYLMDLSTRFPNTTFFLSWTGTVITKSTLWEKTYTELKNIKKERITFVEVYNNAPVQVLWPPEENCRFPSIFFHVNERSSDKVWKHVFIGSRPYVSVPVSVRRPKNNRSTPQCSE